MRRTSRRLTACGGSVLLLLGTTNISAAEAAAPLACGTVITADTTLASSIGPCSGDGIILGADNITLNLNGFEIFGTPGPGDGTKAGVRLPFRTGVSVVGKKQNGRLRGTVRDFDAGIFVNGGARNNVSSLVVAENIGPLDSNSLLGDGIALLHSAGNRIVDNVVTHNGRFDGIGVLGLGSNDNTIRGNRVEDNVGISEAESPEVGPGEIPHYINAPGHGIIVSHFLDQPVDTREAIYRNNVLDNAVRGNAGSGISTVSNLDAVISGNRVEGNSAQYYGDIARFSEPAAPSAVVGIGVTTGGALQDVPTNALVRNNVVNRNGIFGIQIGGHGNRIQRNQVLANGALGIQIDGSWTGNSVIRNTSRRNLILDAEDRSASTDEDGNDVGCFGNRWWDNTYSASVQPLGAELGATVPYFPDCTADGPNGAGPRGSETGLAAGDALRSAAPDHVRARSGGLMAG